MTAVLSMLSPWVRLYQCFITSNSLNKAHRATPTEGVGQSLVRQHLQERTADMDGLNTPSGGNGPSPKRQRTQVVDGQVCPPHGNESHQDLTDNETERVAAIDAAPEAGTEGGPQLSEGFDNMTETVKAGMFMIQSRTQAADIKIDELIEVGEQIFEELKQQFIEKMQGVKLELRNYFQNQTTEWAGTSNSTTELAERLQHAKQLVQGLGLQAISN